MATDPPGDDHAFERAARLLGEADALVIAAGAGIGVDSGLPDFRGNDGFWKAYPALARRAMDFTEIASPRTFGTDPELAWGFYGHRLALYRRTVPHAGFAILKRWSGRMPLGAFVFTSNVDGQFQKADFEAGQVCEHHGSIHRLQCLAPCVPATWPAEALLPDVDEAACRWRGPLPRCPRCGGLARPAILMFGDGGWVDAPFAEQARRLDRWLDSVRRPVVVEIGAGTAIASVRDFSEHLIRRHGGRLVRINPRDSQVPRRSDIGLATTALRGLREIDRRLASA